MLKADCDWTSGPLVLVPIRKILLHNNLSVSGVKLMLYVCVSFACFLLRACILCSVDQSNNTKTEPSMQALFPSSWQVFWISYNPAKLGHTSMDLTQLGGGCTSGARAGHLLIRRLVFQSLVVLVCMPNILGPTNPKLFSDRIHQSRNVCVNAR